MKGILKSIVVAIITWEAKTVLSKYNPRIVAVTGSVGKTSTKDAIYCVLSRFFHARKSEKNYNSEIGIPLTILGRSNAWGNPLLWLKNIYEGLALMLLPNRYPSWLILEVGADRPGDIQTVSQWLRPDVAVITRLSKVPAHVEFFRSVEEIFLEKSFLVRNLKREGVAILNADDEDVLALQRLVESRKFLYGTADMADLRGLDFQIEYGEKREPIGVSFSILSGNKKIKVVVRGVLGVQHMYSILAAASVGIHLGLALEKIAKAVEVYTAPGGRMRILKGLKGSTIIDDTYNSSPVALEEALRTLKQVRTKGKRIAVLGDMLELGIHSTEAHKKAGEQAAKVTDILVTAGIRARFFAEGALNAGMLESNIFQFEDSREAGKFVEGLLNKGDVVLVKGSQGVRMERAVEEIMAEPERKEKLLVRQEKEWSER